jgi:hypothetical protein
LRVWAKSNYFGSFYNFYRSVVPSSPDGPGPP